MFVVAVHVCVALVFVDRAAVSLDELSLIDWVFVCALVPSGAGYSVWFRVRYAAFVNLVVCAGWSVFFMMGMHVLCGLCHLCGIAALACFAVCLGFALLLPCTLFAHLDSVRSRVVWPTNEKAENRARHLQEQY